MVKKLLEVEKNYQKMTEKNGRKQKKLEAQSSRCSAQMVGNLERDNTQDGVFKIQFKKF